jgi:uncharacterized protein (TIGR00369 family)
MNEAAPPLIASSNRQGSGMDYLERIISGEYAQLPIGVTLGFRIASAVPGSVTVRGTPNAAGYNLLGTMHGGWTAAILDTAMALSNLTLLDADQSFTTLDIRINYIRPITIDTGEVTAVGSVINSGRRVAYTEAKLTDAGGKLLAHGTGSLLMLPRGA